MSIYGEYKDKLYETMDDIVKILQNNAKFEHIHFRVKSEESMIEKCHRKGYEVNTHSALKLCKDAIGIRIICSFLNDIFDDINIIKNIDGLEIINEKDYINKSKDNGYRSYHIIVLYNGFYIEIQLRTIAMDSWAALEHQMNYKKNIKNKALIMQELKRCADELASCDISMQTIRDLIEV